MKYRVFTRKSQINNQDKEKDVNSIIWFGDSKEIYFPFFSVIKLLYGNCGEFLNCKINDCDFYRVLVFKQKYELSEAWENKGLVFSGDHCLIWGNDLFLKCALLFWRSAISREQWGPRNLDSSKSNLHQTGTMQLEGTIFCLGKYLLTLWPHPHNKYMDLYVLTYDKELLFKCSLTEFKCFSYLYSVG